MNLLFANFDFEHHLGPSGPRTLSAAVQRIHAELAFALVTIAQPGDFVWAPEPPEPEYVRHLAAIGLPDVRFVSDASLVPEGTNLVPWGWSAHVRQWGTRSGWRCEGPALDAVATANSRAFSSTLEQEWNVGLPHARTVHTLQELDDVVAESTRHAPGWVIKANFGMSARERILGRGPTAAPQAVQWVQKQLAANEAVYFEPWVDRIEEVGVQFTIPKEGEPLFEGITPLLTDHLGTYRGSRFRGARCQFARVDEFPAVLEIVTQAARRIQQLGYFGPLGIDAMRYRTAEGQVRWRPLQDINARLTMGRLALGLERIVPELRRASWLHLPRSEKQTNGNPPIDADLDLASAGAQIIRTSPLTAGGGPTSRVSFVVTAPTDEALFSIETHASVSTR
jgi:hypothetical protein